MVGGIDAAEKKGQKLIIRERYIGHITLCLPSNIRIHRHPFKRQRSLLAPRGIKSVDVGGVVGR